MPKTNEILLFGDKITRCHCCEGTVSFTTNDQVYGTTVGDWPYIYLCDDEKCGAYVGTHAGSDRPLGKMAEASTRRARQQAHAIFDPTWKSGKITRSQAYTWLAEKMGISKAECHIGQFSVEQCETVIRILSKETPSQEIDS